MAIVTLPARFTNAPNRGSDVTQDMVDIYNIVQDINTNAMPVGGGGSASFSAVTVTGQITSTLATGTPPLVIASTTNVPNLNASSLNGATFGAPGAIGSGTPATSIATSGAITQTYAGPTLYANNGNATTGMMNFQMSNTGGSLQYGVERSTGGQLATGTTAYAGVLTTFTNTPLQFGTNSVMRASLDSTGFAVGSAKMGVSTSVNFFADANNTAIRPTTVSGGTYFQDYNGGTTWGNFSTTGNLALTGAVDLNKTSGLPNVSFRAASTYQAYMEGISGGGLLLQTGPGLLGASYSFGTTGVAVTGALSTTGVTTLANGGSGGLYGNDNTSYLLMQASTTANSAAIYLNGAGRVGFEGELHYAASTHKFYNATVGTVLMSVASTGDLTLTARADFKSYTVGTLPAAGVAGGVVYVSDAAVAPCIAFSNGTNWKRCDNAATTVV